MKKGFTLIEIIVSLAIFSVVAVIAVGALVRVTSANKQAQAIQSGVNNISFVLDTISREMRVGSNYTCYQSLSFDPDTGKITTLGPVAPNNCSSNANDTLVLFDSSNVDMTDPNRTNLKYGYLFHNDGSLVTIYKGEEAHTGEMPGSVVFYPVTSQSVKVQKINVGVYGPSAGKPFQWVFIRLKGYVGAKIKDQSVFDIQTSISQRISQE